MSLAQSLWERRASEDLQPNPTKPMNIDLHAPQIILLCFFALSLITANIKHGKPKGDYNAVVAFIDVILWSSLLYWGGFFG